MSVSREKIDGEFTGRWTVRKRIKLFNGEYKEIYKRGFKTKREGLEYERDVTERYNGTANILFKNLLVQYLEDKKQTVKQSTFENYLYTITPHFDFFDDMIVSDITPIDIREYKKYLNSKELKTSTKGIIYTALKNIFKFSMKYNGLKINPCDNVDNFKDGEQKQFNFLTVEEFNQVLEQVKKPIHKMIFNLLFWTGARVGEILALTLDDIDTENKIININKTTSNLCTGEYTRKPKTKDSNRIILIDDDLNEMLKIYLMKAKYITGDKLFTLTRHGLLTYFKTICKKVLNRDCVIHDLRHSHASFLINNGIDVLIISKRLGHSTPTMTLKVYSHLYNNREIEAINCINRIKKSVQKYEQ